MNRTFDRSSGSPAELGRDMVLAEALASLDPATKDPNYWLLFRGWVMTGAAGELARRRVMAELTVSDVLTSWSRTVVPTALLAAAIAGIMLLQAGDAPSARHVGVEELLVSEVSSETVATLLFDNGAEGVVMFASDGF
ncbi:MAG: hypothetical protein OSA81_10850 [Longimicrobiales bacterium]|nr:hypothetical protein [Longimicrobiales bacterium]